MKLVLGNRTDTISDNIYNSITNRAMKYPDRTFYLIVPEQFTLEAQKEMVNRSPNGCILNIDVVSIKRLANRMLDDLGVIKFDFLPEEANIFLTAKIGLDMEKEFKVFGKHIRKAGYIEEIKSLLCELTQYQINSTSLEELLQNDKLSLKLKEKLEDVYKFKKKYEEELGETNLTKEQFLTSASKLVHETKMFDDCEIYFNQFTGFTPDQISFITQLIKKCSYCEMGIIFPNNLDIDNSLSETNRYYLSYKTISQIRQLCDLNYIDFETIRLNDEVKHDVEYKYFSSTNPKDEVAAVHHEIIKLINSGYRYSDIGILYLSKDKYLTTINREFQFSNINIFGDDYNNMSEHSFARYIKSLIKMISNNFSKQTVLTFLKSGYGPLNRNEVVMLEKYITATGVRGFKQYQELFVKRPKYLRKHEKEDDKINDELMININDIRLKFVNEISNIKDNLKKAKVISDYNDALRTYFDEINIKDIIDDITNGDFDSNVILQEEYECVLQNTYDTFDKLDDIVGDKKVSLDEYLLFLNLAFKEIKFATISSTQDDIVVGDMTRTRFGQIKALFIMGASNNNLPNVSNGNLIITDTDKTVLKSCGLTMSPSLKEQIGIDSFYFYLQTISPQEKLYISYSVCEEENDISMLSPIASVLLEEHKATLLEIDKEELLNEEEALKYVTDKINYQKIESLKSKDFESVLSYLITKPENKEKIKLVLDGKEQKVFAGNISQQVAKQLFGTTIKTSVTGLGQFAKCPYNHFLSKGLKLNETEKYEFSVMDNGSLIHEALDKVYKYATDDKKSIRELTSSEISDYTDRAIDMITSNYGNGILYSSEQNKYVITKIANTVKFVLEFQVNKLRAGGFNQVDAEKGYAITFNDDNDLEIKITGKIDKIDYARISDNKMLVNVGDYKTGSRKFSLEDIYDGIDLQLPIYALSVFESLKCQDIEPHIGAVEYLPTKYEVYNNKDRLNRDEISRARQKEIKGSGIINVGKDFVNEYLNLYGSNEDIETYYALTFKKDGSFSKTNKSKFYENDVMTIINYSKYKAYLLGKEISSGKIEPTPLYIEDSELSSTNISSKVCKYCPYANVCKFDKNLNTSETKQRESDTFRDPFDKTEDVQQKILDKMASCSISLDNTKEETKE